MKPRKVSASEARKMWVLYQQMGTYVAVARKVKRSPATVSKYVQLVDVSIAR